MRTLSRRIGSKALQIADPTGKALADFSDRAAGLSATGRPSSPPRAAVSPASVP